MSEQEPSRPRTRDDWRSLGPLLARRHAAGLPPMRDWTWRPIHMTSEWVALRFVGDLLFAPLGVAVYLRLHDGAIVNVGSACYVNGLFHSDDDAVAAFARFDVDADPELIEHHIRNLLEAHLEDLRR